MYTGIKQQKKWERYESNLSKRLHSGTILGDRIRAAISPEGDTPPYIHLYDIFCAILYVLNEGCTWRRLPHDFPRVCPVYRALYDRQPGLFFHAHRISHPPSLSEGVTFSLVSLGGDMITC
jgi:hypothetical protein